jgi:serine/threonine-protein kinase
MTASYTTPGTVLLGKYRVERVLGKGAMGVVIAAVHLGFETRVAIKFMLPGRGPDPERDARFMREARIAARLTSQHVGKVLDVGLLDDGETRYLVMEYLDGQDLDAVLRARGGLPISEAVNYALQVCEAVAEAHKAGIVHRDLKPANLFLTKLADGSPCVKVLDFGVSKLNDGGAELTQERGVLGSPLYMSPEQMQASSKVDVRSDVWALGVVLYQLVADKTPFHGDGIQQVCARVFQGAPTPLSTYRPDAPPGFEAVLFECFEKDRAHRWPNVAAFAAALVPFGPTRAVVHAERAAAILGVDQEVSRPTDLLPLAPAEVAPARSRVVSEGVGGTLRTVANPSAPSLPTQARARPLVTLGLGLGALALGALASLGVALSRGHALAAPEPAVSGVSMPGPSAALTALAAPIAPPPAATVAALPPTSAAPSASALSAPPRGPARPGLPPSHPTSPVPSKPVPSKQSVLDRG